MRCRKSFQGGRVGRAGNKEGQTRQTLMVWTVYSMANSPYSVYELAPTCPGPKQKYLADEIQRLHVRHQLVLQEPFPLHHCCTPSSIVSTILSKVNILMVFKTCNHFPIDKVERIGDRDFAGRIRAIQADENPSAWRSTIWMLHQRFKLDGEQVRFHCEDDQRVNTRIPEWQWCHSNLKTSRGNGAQCIIMRR